MNLAESLEFDKIFSGWSFKELGIAWQVFKFLRQKGIDSEKFDEYIEFVRMRTRISNEMEEKAFFLRKQMWRDEGLKCSMCGSSMILLPVNTSKCTQIADKKIKSTWMCPDEKGCGHQVYNKKSFEWHQMQIAKKMKSKYGNKTIEEILQEPIDKDILKQYKGGGCGGSRNGR